MSLTESRTELQLAESKPADVKGSRVVGKMDSLAKKGGLSFELCLPVNGYETSQELFKSGFSNTGQIEAGQLSRWESLKWHVFEGAALFPKFPKGEYPITAMVAVSRKVKDTDYCDASYVIGRFAAEPIPKHQFISDIHALYDNLVLNPKKTQIEKVASALELPGCVGTVVLGAASVFGFIFTDEIWPLVGLIPAAAAGAGTLTAQAEATVAADRRQNAVKSQISQLDQYFVGKSVTDKIDQLTAKATTNMLMRAVYLEVQKNLGHIGKRKFERNYSSGAPYLKQEEMLELITEYGKYVDEGSQGNLSDKFRGFTEMVSGAVRMNRVTASHIRTDTFFNCR